MSVINFNDVAFKETATYQNFKRENPVFGCLKIRATSANEAVPIENVNIRISKQLGTDTVIFFEGRTDSSGMINNIELPAPPEVTSDEVIPTFTMYTVESTYMPDNVNKIYNVPISANICIIQYINIVPGGNLEMKDNNGN